MSRTPPSLPGSPSSLRRRSDGRILLPRLHRALSPAQQCRGLLGFSSLPPDQGLFFPRVRMVHTFFMRMPIDLAFLSPDGAVRDLHPNLPPWRIAFCREPGPADALEAPAGSFQLWNLQTGDPLEIAPS